MLPKAYEPQEVEQKLADKWQAAKLFAAKNDKSKKPFVIVFTSSLLYSPSKSSHLSSLGLYFSILYFLNLFASFQQFRIVKNVADNFKMFYIFRI